MGEHGIDAIDLLCVNLYRFRETVQKPGISREEIVENIDIGGPAMIRSAAKNHQSVAVVVDPGDYPELLRLLKEHDGVLPGGFLRKLAAKAYAHTAAYDAAIAHWFEAERCEVDGEPRFPGSVASAGNKLADLRYGENPHQQAAFYSAGNAGPSLAGAEQLNGKALSYNNILDADAAMKLAFEFSTTSCVLVKHNNPCGTAVAGDLPRAFELALSGDPVSAFGGILATNRTRAERRRAGRAAVRVDGVQARQVERHRAGAGRRGRRVPDRWHRRWADEPRRLSQDRGRQGRRPDGRLRRRERRVLPLRGRSVGLRRGWRHGGRSAWRQQARQRSGRGC